jgi:hypothetical protein
MTEEVTLRLVRERTVPAQAHTLSERLSAIRNVSYDLCWIRIGPHADADPISPRVARGSAWTNRR